MEFRHRLFTDLLLSGQRNKKKLGLSAVVFPLDFRARDSEIADYVDEAREKNLQIAEVGIWKNVLALDERERAEAREYAAGQLKLADEIGALCCVNTAGTYGGPQWDGGYAENFSPECWSETVTYIQSLIDEVKPHRTRFCLEPMPWMIPTGPDECLRILRDIDREQFGIHLDAVNMINCPERYFHMKEFLDECFEKIGSEVISCHLKDIRLLSELTFQLKETYCGDGHFPIEHYIKLIDQYCPGAPVIIEHLNRDEDYIQSIQYVRKRVQVQ